MHYPHNKHEATRKGIKTQSRSLCRHFWNAKSPSIFLLDHGNPTLPGHSTKAARSNLASFNRNHIHTGTTLVCPKLLKTYLHYHAVLRQAMRYNSRAIRGHWAEDILALLTACFSNNSPSLNALLQWCLCTYQLPLPRLNKVTILINASCKENKTNERGCAFWNP